MRRPFRNAGLVPVVLAPVVSIACGASSPDPGSTPVRALEKFHQAVVAHEYQTACKYAVARPYRGQAFFETQLTSTSTSPGLSRSTTVMRRVPLHGCRSLLSILNREGGEHLVTGPFEVVSSAQHGARATVCVRLSGPVEGDRRSGYDLVATPAGWRVRFAIPTESC